LLTITWRGAAVAPPQAALAQKLEQVERLEGIVDQLRGAALAQKLEQNDRLEKVISQLRGECDTLRGERDAKIAEARLSGEKVKELEVRYGTMRVLGMMVMMMVRMTMVMVLTWEQVLLSTSLRDFEQYREGVEKMTEKVGAKIESLRADNQSAKVRRGTHDVMMVKIMVQRMVVVMRTTMVTWW
jgi:hypothetical protein